MSNFKLDRLFLKRLWILLKVLFPRWRSASVPLTIYVLVISSIDQVITYFVGVLPSEFYVVLGNADLRGFQFIVLKGLAVIVGKCLTLTGIKYSSSVLYVHWRRLICTKLHSLYFQNYSYYFSNSPHSSVDNPDQRITQDVERMCLTLADIFAKLLMSPFVIAYYTYKTYSSSGYVGPLAIYTYFVASTCVNKFILSPIVGVVVRREALEGDFRFKHVSVRSHAESIGFFQAGQIESRLTNNKLETLLSTQQKLINYQFPLNFSMSFFDYFGSILSYLIIAIPIFVWHSYDHLQPVQITGLISQNSFFYMYLINSFSTLVDMSSKISEIAGTTHRIAELKQYLEKYLNSVQDENMEPYTDSSSDKSGQDGNLLFSVNLITFKAPSTDTILVKDLSLDICDQQCVLITGDSGSGKTAFLRVLRGLCSCELGSFHCYVDVAFLPQRPYCTNGSLFQQILYPLIKAPEASRDTADQEVLQLLTFLKLTSLLDRCGGLHVLVDWDWNEVVSPGELQRLSMARVLYRKPKLAFLDEVTSAVGLDLEESFYRACQKNRITYASVGHRQSLKRFHQKHLHFLGNGEWTLTDLPSAND